VQVQAAAGRDGHQQLLHRAHQRRKIGRPQLQWRWLQALAVQHIVQDLPQHLRGITHGGQHLPLARIQVTGSQPLQHAQQGTHRRADLVAHGRQEMALGQRRLLGRAARLGQRYCTRLCFADIQPVAAPLHAAVIALQRSSLRADPAPALRRPGAERNVDGTAHQRGRFDARHHPAAVVGMHRGQQLQMVDPRSLHAYPEQRLHVTGDLRQAVVAGCRTAGLVDHRRQVRGDVVQPLLQHAATHALAMHAPVAEGMQQHEREQDQRRRHQPAQRPNR
jgi:hypothetical protein